MKSNGGTQFFQQDRVYDPKGIAPALLRDKADILVIIDEDKASNEEGLCGSD